DSFIKAILRTYGGAFDHYIPIREHELGRRCNRNYEQVIHDLLQLEKLELLSYYPKSDKPQLQFLQPRSDAAHLHIDRAYMAQRREIRYEQLQAVKDFLDSRNCRSNTLLRYFGETTAAPCGTCD